MSQKLLSYDPSPLPFSTFRSKDTHQYISPAPSTSTPSIPTPHQTITDPNFHLIHANESHLSTFTHAMPDPSESLAFSLSKMLRKLHFEPRIIESTVFVSTTRVILAKEIVTGEWRRRHEQQEYLQNLRRVEIMTEIYPRNWISMVHQPVWRLGVGILGIWAPIAWDALIFGIGVILGFVDKPSHVGVIVALTLLSFFAFISRLVQIAVVSISIWRLGRVQSAGDLTATQEMAGDEGTMSPPDATTKDTALSQSSQPALIQTPLLYIIIILITLLCNIATFALSFLAFAHSNYGALAVAFVASASIFFSLISLAVMPKFSNRYAATVKLYFAEITSQDHSLKPDRKLSNAEAHTQGLIFYLIVGFLFGWIPGALLAALLYYSCKTQPQDLGYLQEDNERIMTIYLSFRDAQNLKALLWRTRSHDVLYYDDPMLR